MQADLAVATITWARSDSEEALLRQCLDRLHTTGLRIAVADRGTSATFTPFLAGFDRIRTIMVSGTNLVDQVKASFRLAATFKTSRILYTEPDKELFFERHLNGFLRHAERWDTGVTLAARSDESFETFPSMQRYTEGIINHLCSELIGSVGDYSYGPFVAPGTIAPFVDTLDSGLGWGWRHAVFMATHRAGHAVRHVPGDYICRPDQRGEDDTDRRHRLRQLSQNLLGLLY